MKVSIVIPTYECADLLRTTLTSIQLGGWDDLEVIVIDGGSKDHVAEVVASFGELVSIFVSEPDEGQYHAINKGMARASGEVLCWINGGDFFLPGAVGNAVEVFRKDPKVSWLTGRPCVAEGVALRRQGNHEVLISDVEIRYGLCCGGATGFLQQEGMFWRRSLWESAGPLDTTYRLAADYELWIRFAREARLARFTIPLAAFSYHETNRSVVQRDAYMDEVEAIVAGLPENERRRRRILSWFPWVCRAVRRIPLVKDVFRIAMQRVGCFGITVVSWKRSPTEGFKLKIARRISWIR